MATAERSMRSIKRITRAGSVAYVRDMGSGDRPLVGYYVAGTDSYPCSWMADGQYYDEEVPRSLDLV